MRTCWSVRSGGGIEPTTYGLTVREKPSRAVHVRSPRPEMAVKSSTLVQVRPRSSRLIGPKLINEVPKVFGVHECVPYPSGLPGHHLFKRLRCHRSLPVDEPSAERALTGNFAEPLGRPSTSTSRSRFRLGGRDLSIDKSWSTSRGLSSVCCMVLFTVGTLGRRGEGSPLGWPWRIAFAMLTASSADEATPGNRKVGLGSAPRVRGTQRTSRGQIG